MIHVALLIAVLAIALLFSRRRPAAWWKPPQVDPHELLGMCPTTFDVSALGLDWQDHVDGAIAMKQAIEQARDQCEAAIGCAPIAVVVAQGVPPAEVLAQMHALVAREKLRLYLAYKTLPRPATRRCGDHVRNPDRPTPSEQYQLVLRVLDESARWKQSAPSN